MNLPILKQRKGNYQKKLQKNDTINKVFIVY